MYSTMRATHNIDYRVEHNDRNHFYVLVLVF